MKTNRSEIRPPQTEANEPLNNASGNPREPYRGPQLDRIAFPLGGIGAGMVCLEGNGTLSHLSVRHQPDLLHEPGLFGALTIREKETTAKVLEGPVPYWKVKGRPRAEVGLQGSNYGLPRFREATFQARFPFATIDLHDPEIPLQCSLTGWSPFTPGKADRSSLPVAALEYTFTNPTNRPVDAVFSFHAPNFMRQAKADPASVRAVEHGFELWAGGPEKWDEGIFSVTVDASEAEVNHRWFRGGWYDPLSILWKEISSGSWAQNPPVTTGAPSPGGSIFVPFTLAPGETRKMVVRLAWFVGQTKLRICTQGQPDFEQDQAALERGTYRPWYAAQFRDGRAITEFWVRKYNELREETKTFTDCFQDSTIPPEVLEAVGANLSILKSPTLLRQEDGQLWAWEGSGVKEGSCPGTCTHVWNYAQAIAHLFPELEQGLRETEFGPNQSPSGHQQFRAALPIRPCGPYFHAAADGQLGGILKVHRDWRISGDSSWLRTLWPQVRQSLNYCIEIWDPGRRGWLEEPHHNTYDIEFWGPDGMCTSLYVAALKAAVVMGRELGEDIAAYQTLHARAKDRLENELFDGEYFVQKVVWENLRAPSPVEVKSIDSDYSEEAIALLEREGPKYQYGSGCLSDGIIGDWMARSCFLDDAIDPKKVRSHLNSIFQYNLRRNLRDHANPQRPGFALGGEGGLLLCSWPKSEPPSLPFIYSNEVWTGIEYQVAAHLIMLGRLEEGLEIVRICRSRYDGSVRNPFDEYECGQWYARALASYGLLQAISGARYDATTQILDLRPTIKGDFQCFLSTGTGFGLVGVRAGNPFLEVRRGSIPVQRIEYLPRVD